MTSILTILVTVLKLFSLGADYLQRKGMISEGEALLVADICKSSLARIESAQRIRADSGSANGVQSKPGDFRD